MWAGSHVRDMEIRSPVTPGALALVIATSPADCVVSLVDA